MYKPFVLCLALICTASLTAQRTAAEQGPSAKLRAMRTASAIVLDGRLDESAWGQSQWVTHFTQRELDLGEPATARTEVSVAYDNEALYIGVRCFDSQPDKITAKEQRRDFDYGLDDNFIVVIDTYRDRRNGFMFVTNPNGARADLQVFNNGASTNAFWDGVWQVKTTVDGRGWFAEFRIPLSTLKYRANVAEQVWGINFERNVRRKREQVRWQGWGRNYDIENVGRAGQLTGLNNLSDKKFIELKPYGLAGAQREQGENTAVLNAGGDVNYLLSPAYRLNVSFNTDFAQVEADEQQVNLTRFPLFFPEQRAFFLEGEDYFDFAFGGNRIVPFYSRRIGLNEARETVPIIAAGRLLGKERNTTLGLMSLQTADDGWDRTTNYTVAGWRQDVGRQSVVGAVSANKISNGRWHTSTGLNGRYSTSELFGNRNFEVGGAAIATYNTDSGIDPMAWAYRVFASYPNDLVNAFASMQRSPGAFDPELGLQRRRNFREYFATVSLGPRPKTSLLWIKQFDFSPGEFTLAQYDDNGGFQSLEYALRPLGFETRSGETFALEYRVLGEGLRHDFEIFPGVTVPAGEHWWREWQAEFTSFPGRDVSLEARANWGGFYGGKAFRGQGDLVWRASKYLNVSLRYEKNIVDLPGGKFDTDLPAVRLAYAFTPDAFGAVLTQWNSAAQELNFNFRLRTIPKPGTDFYLIFNQFMSGEEGKLHPVRTTVLAKLIWRFVV